MTCVARRENRLPFVAHAFDISGLGTIVSGAYMNMDITDQGTPTTQFTGLELPPARPLDAKGLRNLDRGSLMAAGAVRLALQDAGLWGDDAPLPRQELGIIGATHFPSLEVVEELVKVVLEQGVHPIVDQAALAAVERTRFLPALQDGEPVRGDVVMSFDFQEDLD